MEKMKMMKKVSAMLLVLFTLFAMMPQMSAHAASSAELTVEERVYNYAVSEMGLNTAGAVAILANIEYESNFKLSMVSDGGTSYGLVQWHRTRWTALKNYCANHGLNHTTLEGQLAYLNYELNTRQYKSILNYIRSVPNTAQGAYNAAYHWCYYFEIPTNKAVKSAVRGNTAKNKYWNKYKDFGGKPITVDDIMNKATYTRVLKTGAYYMSGTDVRYIQIKLKSLGYSIDTDGIYGKGTAAVVKQFQKDYGLAADGICGAATWNAISKAVTAPKTLAVKSATTANAVAITAQPQDVTIAVTEPAVFTVKASGKNLSYQWYYRKANATSWTKWNSATSATAKTPIDSTWNGAQVYCVVKDGTGKTANSAAATITLKDNVKITAQPQDVTVKKGTVAQFSVKASGTGLTYQWYYKKSGAKSWSKWNGHTAAATSGTANDTWNGMQVYCEVKDASGTTVNSNAAAITLIRVTKIASQPQDVTVKAGEYAVFTVQAGGEGLTYQWYYKKAGAKNWSKWNGHTTARTTATANDTWDGMQVYCAVKDSSGQTVNSSAATVTVK